MTALGDACLKDTGLAGLTGHKLTVKEGRSVSKSSSATTCCEPSSYEESDAKKVGWVAWDGSGSIVGSPTETAKPLREPDEISNSSARCELAQDGWGGDSPQQFKSLTRAGAMKSVGSAGHPNSCTPCSFYCFSRLGCRLDRDCTYCHLFHQSSRRKRREGWKFRQLSSKPPGSTEDVGRSLPKDSGEAQPPDVLALRPGAPPGLSRACTQEDTIQQVLPSSVPCSLLPATLSAVPAEQTATWLLAEVLGAHTSSSFMSPSLPMPAQGNNLCKPLLNQTSSHIFEYRPGSLKVCVGQMVEAWPPVSHLRNRLFVAAPHLPRGVKLDGRSGLLYGRLAAERVHFTLLGDVYHNPL